VFSGNKYKSQKLDLSKFTQTKIWN